MDADAEQPTTTDSKDKRRMRFEQISGLVRVHEQNVLASKQMTESVEEDITKLASSLGKTKQQVMQV